MYEYKAVVKRVIDGDTVVLDIDLGFRTWLRDEHVRLFGINTPELTAKDPVVREAAKAAKAFVEVRLPVGAVIALQSIEYDGGRDKYGRVLGIIRYVADGNTVELNKQLLEENLATAY